VSLKNRHVTKLAHVTTLTHATKFAHVTVLSQVTKFKKSDIHTKLTRDAEVAYGECYACACVSLLTYVSLVACVSLVFLFFPF
jgi:RNase P/RNase MRP subunit POP5